jgi:hypothetical protein
MAGLSPQRRKEIIGALRRGTVPHAGLDALAVGLERFEAALAEEMKGLRAGHASFKAVRGEYGSGKTFFVRWLQERARGEGFATTEVQVSETETPLHRLETVYRRLMERIATPDSGEGALRAIIDGWFFALEEDALQEGRIRTDDSAALLARTSELMEARLGMITQSAPAFAAALRSYREALVAEDHARAEGLIAWIGGQPNVAANIKRGAGIKGDIDHFGALSFLQGVLLILRDSGVPGLVVVLDEVETLQRVRGDMRDKGLNALRQLMDEIDGGRFPGLYLVITGTPAFFEGPQGVERLPPLAQRLHVDFSTEMRFDNPRAVQIRLSGFDLGRLSEVGRKVRSIYQQESAASERIQALVDDRYIDDFAKGVTGELGGRVGVAPRLFLKKLVADVLDRVDQYPDFDPRKHYHLTLSEKEMTAAERAVLPAAGVDEIELPS